MQELTWLRAMLDNMKEGFWIAHSGLTHRFGERNCQRLACHFSLIPLDPQTPLKRKMCESDYLFFLTTKDKIVTSVLWLYKNIHSWLRKWQRESKSRYTEGLCPSKCLMLRRWALNKEGFWLHLMNIHFFISLPLCYTPLPILLTAELGKVKWGLFTRLILL